VLFRVLDEHLDDFLRQAAVASDDDAGGVPGFVQNELRDYLACGVLSGGFARFKCTACPFEHLVALSCKGRGFCPSCGGKRMTNLAAELTDRVIPLVPVRQFVLSLPHRLRYWLAYDHDRCIAVLRIYIRALLSFYRRRACKAGVRNGRNGAVTFIQRFGSAANLNVHFHVVALDGVFVSDEAGKLTFHAAKTPNEAEVTQLVGTVRRRVLRHLERRGLLDADSQDSDPINQVSPVLASCYAGSIAGRQTLGRRKGAKLERIGVEPEAPWTERKGRRLSAQIDGFDLHAGLRVAADHHTGREQLEKLLRYCARPPLSEDRLSYSGDRVVLRLKTPWRDGTTHVVYEPSDFVAKLAALVPRPNKNLVLYHGVLSAHAAWRARVVAYGRDAAASALEAETTGARCEPPRHERQRWAVLMKRAFGFDVLSCAQCGGRMRLIAVVLERAAIRKVLAHLGLPIESPEGASTRGPPGDDGCAYDVA
jgi:hypothetical protein